MLGFEEKIRGNGGKFRATTKSRSKTLLFTTQQAVGNYRGMGEVGPP